MGVILLPLLFFILYLVLVYRYHLYNNIIDKLVSICLILYYSIMDIRYGLIACFLMIVYLNTIPRPNQTYRLTETFDQIDSPIAAADAAEKKPDIPKIELVIARYNETLNWVNRDPFDKYPVYIYNKGSNDNYTVNNTNVRIKTLDNVGKCDHTYLYHIIENYDNLADVTVFLPGSTNMKYKIGKAKRILSELKQKIGSVFIGNFIPDVKKSMYNFMLDEWKTSNKENFIQNKEEKLQLSKIRPFGKWFEKTFGNITITHVSQLGIMAISKEHILQHPKKYYENLIKEFETSSNPEVGHYFERAWEAVFYPMTGAIFILRQ